MNGVTNTDQERIRGLELELKRLTAGVACLDVKCGWSGRVYEAAETVADNVRCPRCAMPLVTRHRPRSGA